MAVVLFHNAVHGRESKPGALAQLLGGEEGLEETLLGLRVHAGPGVRDGQHHVRAGLHFYAVLHILLIESHVGRLDGQLAAVGHCVARVDRQVHEHLLDLPGVDADTIEGPGWTELQFHILADEPSEHLGGVLDQLIEIDHLGPEGLLPAERKELPRQPGRAVAQLADLGQITVDLGALLHLIEGERGVAFDAGEQVIEVVRHAAGQLADGLQLLRLAQLLFEQLALGGVREEADGAGPRVDLNRSHVDVGVNHGSVLAPTGNLARQRHVPPHLGLDHSQCLWEALAWINVLDAQTEHLLLGVAQQAADRRVGVPKRVGLHVRDQDAFGGPLE